MSMVRKFKRPNIGRNQCKILEILEKYEELTAKDIAEILWARDTKYQTPVYRSVHRSLVALCGRGMVKKVGGRLKWRKSRKRLPKETLEDSSGAERFGKSK